MTYQLRIYKNGLLERHDTLSPETSLRIDVVQGFLGMSVVLEYEEERSAMIPENTALWDGIWVFRIEGTETCWGHDWQPWTGNFATRKRVCKNCKREEFAEHVL